MIRFWISGELLTLYSDWKILEFEEAEPLIIRKNLRPHIYNYVIAKKCSG
ncbi:hypothetical protein [Hungatella sp.]|nr:hypothetical protein [Hungatella sp.]